MFLSDADVEAVVPGGDFMDGFAFDAAGNFYLVEDLLDNIIQFPVLDISAGTIDTTNGSVFVSNSALVAAGGINTTLSSGIAWEPLPVPEPSALAIFLAGLGCLTLGKTPHEAAVFRPPFSCVLACPLRSVSRQAADIGEFAFRFGRGYHSGTCPFIATARAV